MFEAAVRSAHLGPLVAQDLSVVTGGRTLVAGADLTVAPGDTIALVGEPEASAALLRVLAGLQRPTAGWVQWGGQDLYRMSDSRRSTLRRRHVGTLLNADLLFDTLPVIENIALPLMLDGMPHLDAATAAADLLDVIGLTGLGARTVDSLDPMQQTLVALGRALVSGPSLLVAADPISHLSRREAALVVSTLFAVCERRGTSVVLATDEEGAGRCRDILRVSTGRLQRARREAVPA